MKQTYLIIGLICLIVLQSCGLRNQENISANKPDTDLFDKYSNDSIRNVNFKIAYDNKSTAPNYLVFKATDLNTGLTKEICCEAPFLSGAIHRELGIDYDTKGTDFVDSLINANTSRTFKFENQEALKNVSFNEYPDYDRLLQIAKGIDLDYYYKTYGANDSSKLMYFESDTGFVQITFVHAMFNCGILTRRDCEAGNNIWFGN